MDVELEGIALLTDPILNKGLTRFRLRQSAMVFALLFAVLLATPHAAAEEQQPTYPVGIRQIEFFDGSRYFALAVFYPADLPDKSAPTFNLPFFVICISTKMRRSPDQERDFRW
jgi:hypothetical protein